MLRTFPMCAAAMSLLGIAMWLLNYQDNSNGQWLAIFSMGWYIISFSVGLASTPWTVNSEVYPLHLRGIGNSLSTFGNWFANYFISAFFLTATDTTLGQVKYFFFIKNYLLFR